MNNVVHKSLATAAPVFVALGIAACQPTVKVEAPDKPIVINLNVNISHEVRVKIDRDLDRAIDTNSKLF